MPPKISLEREREYEELFAYLDFYATHVRGIPAGKPIHPANIAKAIAKQVGRSKALDGLRQAANDTVEELVDRPIEYVRRLDEALRARGIITFSEIRRRYSSSYKRILKRGRIATETEYYIVAGILADVSSAVDDEGRTALEQLVAQYGQQNIKDA